MNGLKWLLASALLATGALAWADETVAICFNYGCAAQAPAVFSEARLDQLQGGLALAADAGEERRLLAVAVGILYGWAGEQTPVGVDKGGNFADQGEYGSMDCIDHSLTTERLLLMLERRHALRFHRVVGRVRRMRFLIVEHNAVVIEETMPAAADGGAAENAEDAEDAESRRYVVDSWYRDNGRPAVVLPLRNWMKGEGGDD